jgi:hypothetical protein
MKRRNELPRRRLKRGNPRKLPVAPLPELMSVEDAEKLTGLGERRLRTLAAEGFFPQPIETRFNLVETVHGVLAFYRDAKNRYRESVDRLKAVKLERETQKIDLELRRMEGETVEIKDVNAFLLHVATLQKTALYQALQKELPPRAHGKTEPELAVLGREVAEKLCEIFSQKLTEWTKNRQA